ncbi:hypothetical protein G7075_05900 [Phycicoccus sp. HDW14]|uniref:hypothetical protein n=1 Tax=Phycicoccus sp. HDW14 TaxID=2714941 RepID=UPI00140B186C|nr:hypothetical protein [Phycicoccus sp. HDW14]QIM20783.1 hypothetical protein G7075_05900 [Phycicoccus sp. HDW14]
MQHDTPIGSIVVAVDADAPVDSVLVAAADVAASTHRPCTSSTRRAWASSRGAP